MQTVTPRRSVLLASFSLVLASIPPIVASESHPHFDEGEAFLTQVRITTKRFWIAARRHNADRMRETIDPEYLKMHGLMDGPLTFPEITTDNLYDVRLADDKSTVLCQIEKSHGSTSILLLRLVRRGDELFVQPPRPPVEDSGVVVPWLLHAKLTD